MKRKIFLLFVGVSLFSVFLFFNNKVEKKKNQHKLPDPLEGFFTPLPELIDPKFVDPEFIDVPKVSDRIKSTGIYADIINHSRNPVLEYDKDTNAHETTHMINSDIRNSHSTGKKMNGFYIPGGRGILVDEPNFRKNDIIKYLPANLRSYRYSTYVSGQQEWDDTPTYIFDEWTAYINGGEVSVELALQKNNKPSWTDAVSGCLDFSIYSIAVAMACKDKDPEFWENNKQFRNFLVWQLKRAYKTYEEGSKMEQFRWEKQDRLLLEFLESKEAKPMRDFVAENLDGVWLDAEKPIMADYPTGKIRLHIIPPLKRAMVDPEWRGN